MLSLRMLNGLDVVTKSCHQQKNENHCVRRTKADPQRLTELQVTVQNLRGGFVEVLDAIGDVEHPLEHLAPRVGFQHGCSFVRLRLDDILKAARVTILLYEERRFL